MRAFLFIFLVILIINYVHLIEINPDRDGSRKIDHERARKGKAKIDYPIPIQQQYSSTEEKPIINSFIKIEFSLIELSVLIRFLRSISEPMPYNLKEMQVIESLTKDVLKNNFNEELYNAFINDFESGKGTKFSFKIYQIINYYAIIMEANETASCNTFRIDDQDRNYFYFWHLFGVARELLRQFVANFHISNKYYNYLLRNENKLEEISIQSYAEAYDIFEVKANLLMKELKKNENLANDDCSFLYHYYDAKIMRKFILMSLRTVEDVEEREIDSTISEFNKYVIYPVQFAINELIEVSPTINIYWPIIYRNSLVKDPIMTHQMCNYINENIIDPNTNELTVPFYLFFYNMDINIQNILQQTITNKYFINKLLKEPKEYLDENIVNLIDIGNNIFVPPQEHLDLVKEICDENLNQLNKKLHDEENRQGRKRGRNQHHGSSSSGHNGKK